MLAVAHPWVGVCLFLSLLAVPRRSSLAATFHATWRSSHARSSLSCRFILCLVALLGLVCDDTESGPGEDGGKFEHDI